MITLIVQGIICLLAIYIALMALGAIVAALPYIGAGAITAGAVYVTVQGVKHFPELTAGVFMLVTFTALVWVFVKSVKEAHRARVYKDNKSSRDRKAYYFI